MHRVKLPPDQGRGQAYSWIILLIVAGLFLPVASAQEWKVVREDDFARADGIEGDLKAICFIDQNSGWAVGLQGLVLQTVDGGQSWEKVDLQQERVRDLWNIYFSTDKVGFITGTGGMLLMTADGGQTWNQPELNNRRRITRAWMVTEQLGFMVGENSTILKSVDGGQTWSGESERVRVGEKRTNLDDICFVSPTEGWIVGSFGTVMHTTDAGESWEQITLEEIDHNLYAVFFIDPKTGWISGQEGLVLHTTDGGQTWNQQETDAYDDLHDIVFIDKQRGWTVGGDIFANMILHTADGGETWEPQSGGRSTALRSISVDKQEETHHIWIGGGAGIILHGQVN